ncbi:NrdH-redoxin [Candidatus Kaiserbacteria bacterium]|nr:NrdH-redoxin [Candidatus Kaiserbacteria bacterium]
MKTVTIYSLPTCHFCHEAKAFLTENSIPFTDYDVSVDEARKNEMIEKSGQLSVPVIFVDGEMVLGFDKPKLTALLGIQ